MWETSFKSFQFLNFNFIVLPNLNTDYIRQAQIINIDNFKTNNLSIYEILIGIEL